MNHFLLFRNSFDYLEKYHRKNALVLFCINLLAVFTFKDMLGSHPFEYLWLLPIGLLIFRPIIELVFLGTIFGFLLAGSILDVSALEFGWVLASVAVSLTVSSLIHCASHRSIRPEFLNTFTGELAGLFQLSGFADWKIVHVFHHQFSDHPDKDPHAPGRLGFWKYTRGMRQQINGILLRHYKEIHGLGPREVQSLNKYKLYATLSNVQKVVFWALILGPKLFLIFWVPSVLAKMLIFSWLNWRSHNGVYKGESIQNRTQGIYPILNFFSFGLFYHGNHHLHPTRFNPSQKVNKPVNSLSESA